MRNRIDRALEAFKKVEEAQKKSDELKTRTFKNINISILVDGIYIERIGERSNLRELFLSFEEFEELINAGNDILFKTPDEEDKKHEKEKKPSISGEYVRDGVTYRKFRVPVSGEGTADVDYETVEAIVKQKERLKDGDYLFNKGILFIAKKTNSDFCETCEKSSGAEMCFLCATGCRFKKVNGWLQV